MHERTLRRAVGAGLIRAQRPSARRISLADSEIAWVRAHWPVVSKLLSAFRTEPNVELAVIFGSLARGDVDERSDIDLLVELRRSLPGDLDALRGRLAVDLGIDVELVPLRAASDDPHLLAEILRDGRPLVDRTDTWESLQAQRAATEARAEREGRTLHEEARAAVGYFQRLAAERPMPLATDR